MTSMFSWSELAFSSKKPLKSLDATFIAAPRHISSSRLKQLIKQFLPKGNIVLGFTIGGSIDGFENQPQFASLQWADVQDLVEQVNAASPRRQIATLTYAAADEPHIIAKDLFTNYVFINGSWKHSFHLRPSFYALAKLAAPYQLVSPFTHEAEAKAYADTIWPLVVAATPLPNPGATLTAAAALQAATIAGQRSFDHTFQTGVILAKPTGPDAYQFIAASWNAVVPYQSYAMHYGSTREQNFSPPGDLNYYDTNHAEMALLVQAATEHIDLAGTTMFINLLPCPTCARILSATTLDEIIYRLDHSAGYAEQIMTARGKRIRHQAEPPLAPTTPA